MATFPQILTKIRLEVSEKTSFTGDGDNDGRTTRA